MLGILLKFNMINKTSIFITRIFNSDKIKCISTKSILSVNIRANINKKNKTVELSSKSDSADKIKILEFPFVWLRDNCNVGIKNLNISFNNLIIFV